MLAALPYQCDGLVQVQVRIYHLSSMTIRSGLMIHVSMGAFRVVYCHSYISEICEYYGCLLAPCHSYSKFLRRNHASNAYMLHALGITHVVSVGECALIPPPNGSAGMAATQCTTKQSSDVGPSSSSERRGSLYIEEREGRIKVLDIKGVCDDGIDTLEPQLAPICEWIDRAREQGGKVLVHCRVGVSRSATVTIAYVMKNLGITLVEAYLIVRSRRLSVLIQPNMRLMYNLCGWEVKLAAERAAGDQERLRTELARCVNWPYLAREVHLLNEKYLHV